MKKFIIPALAIIAIVTTLIILTPSTRIPQIVERSVPQGDYIADTTQPIEACNSIAKEVQNSNSQLYCVLIHSEKVDTTDDLEKCVDGPSVAGCFNCIFECK